MAAIAKCALVIGGSRGYGRALVDALSAQGVDTYSTYRTPPTSVEMKALPKNVKIIPGIDLYDQHCSVALVKGLKEAGLEEGGLDLVVFSAGYFTRDTLGSLDWAEHIKMYTICSIAPAFIASALLAANLYAEKAKFLMISTEGGSITLRTKEEGGGNYAHHCSKAAQNMSTRLLSLDLGEKGITVVAIHPGFMRTSMTAKIGYDEFWDSGHAVEPTVAAENLLSFVEGMSMASHHGRFFAPGGPRDIGQAERVLGKDLPTPLELPW